VRNATAWGNAPGNNPRNAPALKARHTWGQPLTQAFNITRRWRSLEFKLPLITQELLFARVQLISFQFLSRAFSALTSFTFPTWAVGPGFHITRRWRWSSNCR